MAKRRKPKVAPDVAELEQQREWLIRCVLIGQGYVRRAMETTQDQRAHRVYQQHFVEMDRALSEVRPVAEDVLKLLGRGIANARTNVEDSLRYARPLAEMHGEKDGSFYAVVNHTERALKTLAGEGEHDAR